ncbi:hypothetical protein [Nonomuraea diastatica]|uniref:hypothetical protein n=1 Tax=Nonomuraea diastatica TaxID=1848329 RepID=UPI001C7063ED|nr:hypothetical protein [Nonomuraea diastatica]
MSELPDNRPGEPGPGQCARCLINQRLNELLGPSNALHPGLEALRHNIATTEHPITARLNGEEHDQVRDDFERLAELLEAHFAYEEEQVVAALNAW